MVSDMRLRVGCACAVLLGLTFTTPATAQEQTATELASALQRRYDTVRDFSADFVHTYRGGVLNKQLSESGRLLVKKPGKMRWEYRKPEEKLFVSDGEKMFAYIPADKQVLVSAVPTGEAATTPALFLAGKGQLTRDFTVSTAEPPAGQPAGTRALKLVPKTAQPDYDWLVLAVDPRTLALRALVTMDAQGGTSAISFTNLKENVGVADSQFEFKPPRGVEIVTDSSAN